MPNSIVPLPLPLKGLKTIDPFGLEPGFARELTNYSIFNGRIYMRPAVRSEVLSTSLSEAPHWIDASSAPDWYCILRNGAIRKLSDSSGATSIGGSCGSNATVVKHASLELVIGCREPRISVNPFTAWTFTTISMTASSINCACSHKGRLYVCDGSNLEYSEVGAVSGTMIGKFPLTAYLAGQTAIRIFSLTISPNDKTQSVLVIFGDGGKVIIYTGEYPKDPSWDQMASYNMPPPISNLGFIELNGDAFVASTQYAYFFRDLILGGAQSAYESSPSWPIENIWAGTFWVNSAVLPETSHCYYDSVLDAIITQSSDLSSGPNNFGLVANYSNEAMCFVYFRKYRAWTVWFTTPFFAPVVSRGSGGTTELYGTGYITHIVKLTRGNAIDQVTDGSTNIDIPIEASWKTPYVSPFEGRLQKVNGIRPYFEHSLSGYLEKCRVVFDNSDYNSTLGWYTQSMVSQINPGNYQDSKLDIAARQWKQYHERLGGGGIGGGFSVQFTQRAKSSSSATQSQSLYAAVAYVEDGGELI